MRATSKASFEAASERWEPVLAKAAGRGVRFGQELYELSDLLERNVSLSRALTDPSRSAPDKAALVESIARGKVDDEVADLLVDLVQLRWSAPTNLSHALEVLAVDAILASAQARGALETVEDEIFRFGRLLASERELRRALADKQVSIERRLALADGLVAGKVQPESQLFIHRSVSDLRARSIFSALHSIGDRAAARRARLVATVIAASPLTAAQAARLRSILEQAYGRSVRVNVGVDEKLVGGLRIAIGSDLVDASIVGRLDEARRRLAG
jgi:F-type H+-transporting ATPase subunit delta